MAAVGARLPDDVRAAARRGIDKRLMDLRPRLAGDLGVLCAEAETMSGTRKCLCSSTGVLPHRWEDRLLRVDPTQYTARELFAHAVVLEEALHLGFVEEEVA